MSNAQLVIANRRRRRPNGEDQPEYLLLRSAHAEEPVNMQGIAQISGVKVLVPWRSSGIVAAVISEEKNSCQKTSNLKTGAKKWTAVSMKKLMKPS